MLLPMVPKKGIVLSGLTPSNGRSPPAAQAIARQPSAGSYLTLMSHGVKQLLAQRAAGNPPEKQLNVRLTRTPAACTAQGVRMVAGAGAIASSVRFLEAHAEPLVQSHLAAGH
jgi:hypothetical protein